MLIAASSGGSAARRRITAAARTLFAARGFHSTSMAMLAAHAEVSVGQIYRLFAGKEDIIAAIVSEDADARARELEALSGALAAGAIDLPAAFHALVVQALAREHEALSFEILAEAYRNEAVARTTRGLCGRYRTALRALLAHAHPHFGEEALAAGEELLLACLFGLGHRKISAPLLPAEAQAALTARMLLGAIASLA